MTKKLHVFIDGSWLFKICGAEGVSQAKEVFHPICCALSYEEGLAWLYE